MRIRPFFLLKFDGFSVKSLFFTILFLSVAIGFKNNSITAQTEFTTTTTSENPVSRTTLFPTCTRGTLPFPDCTLPDSLFPAGNVNGCNPLTVKFNSDNLTDVTTRRFWNFGDGETSSKINPVHTYKKPGLYTVSAHVQCFCNVQRLYIKEDFILVEDCEIPIPPPTIVTTIPVTGMGPITAAVNPTTNLIYVANLDSDNVVVIDGTTNQVINTITVGDFPVAIAVNPETNRTYVANADSNNVSVIDNITNKVINTITVGNSPRGIAVNPTTNRIYVANGLDDTISVIDGTTNQVINTITVGLFPFGVDVNAKTNLIYVAISSNDTVSVMDGVANQVIDTVSVGAFPEGVSVDPITNRIYVSNRDSNTVSVINCVDSVTNHRVIDTVGVGVTPSKVGINQTTNRIYVTNRDSNNVSIIDGVINKVIGTVTVGVMPRGIGVNSNTNLVYVSNLISDDVTIIFDKGVIPTPIARFTSSSRTVAPDTFVNFIDQSIGTIDTWLWDFGDGRLTSTFQNPSHAYIAEGSFKVSLAVTGPGGSATETKTDFIKVQTTTTTTTSTTSSTTTTTTSTTIPTTGKSFTFNCEHSMKRGFFGLESLTMNVGDIENCTLKLTNHVQGQTKEVSTQITNWFWSGIKIEPARSVTDENGELRITITAIKKGADWAAWAVPNDKGQFQFNKKTYDTGLAWGMFVKVR